MGMAYSKLPMTILTKLGKSERRAAIEEIPDPMYREYVRHRILVIWNGWKNGGR